jgi:hypothetical protein
LPVSDVALSNLYYDALKVVLGCTAFAVDAGEATLHARNLDWWTKNAALARYTTVCHFIGGAGGPFTTIGWPGFVGAFSGVAPGRFAITLNAVLSLERAQLVVQFISIAIYKVPPLGMLSHGTKSVVSEAEGGPAFRFATAPSLTINQQRFAAAMPVDLAISGRSHIS